MLSDLSPVGLFRVNSNGAFIYANQRWRDITGVPLSEEASFESMCVLIYLRYRVLALILPLRVGSNSEMNWLLVYEAREA